MVNNLLISHKTQELRLKIEFLLNTYQLIHTDSSRFIMANIYSTQGVFSNSLIYSLKKLDIDTPLAIHNKTVEHYLSKEKKVNRNYFVFLTRLYLYSKSNITYLYEMITLLDFINNIRDKLHNNLAHKTEFFIFGEEETCLIKYFIILDNLNDIEKYNIHNTNETINIIHAFGIIALQLSINNQEEIIIEYAINIIQRIDLNPFFTSLPEYSIFIEDIIPKLYSLESTSNQQRKELGEYIFSLVVPISNKLLCEERGIIEVMDVFGEEENRLSNNSHTQNVIHERTEQTQHLMAIN
jgi:hypothetical protein